MPNPTTKATRFYGANKRAKARIWSKDGSITWAADKNVRPNELSRKYRKKRLTIMARPDIMAVIVCDDVRREANGKEILIGVYAGDIMVQSFPAVIATSIWLAIRPTEKGPININFRLSLEGKEPISLQMQGETSELQDGSMTLPTIGINVEEPSFMLLEMQKNDEWVVLMRKPIRLAPSVAP